MSFQSLKVFPSTPFDELTKHIVNNILLQDAIGMETRRTDIIPPGNNQDPRRQNFIKKEAMCITRYDWALSMLARN